MTSPEDRLRAIRDADVPGPSSRSELRRRISRRRLRRGAGGVFGVLVLVAGIAFAVARDDAPTQVDTVDDPATTSPTSGPSSTTSSSATSTTSTTEPYSAVAGTEVAALELPAGEPLGLDELAVALFRDGGGDPGTNDLAVVSALDGSVIRTLDTVGVSEGGISDIALSADRRTILTTQGTSACTGPIRAYPADGSGDVVEYDQFANALQLAVSADGALLAVSSDDDCDGHHTLTLWPLGTGTGTTYVFGDGGDDLVGLPGQVDDGSSTTYDPTLPSVRSIAFAADGSLSYVISSSGESAAYRLQTPTGPSARYESAQATMPAGGTTDVTLLDFVGGSPSNRLVVLADTGSGLVLGEVAAGETLVENVLPVDDEVHDLSAVGLDKVWVTADQQLFRFLETSVIRLRTDVVQVGG